MTWTSFAMSKWVGNDDVTTGHSALNQVKGLNRCGHKVRVRGGSGAFAGRRHPRPA